MSRAGVVLVLCWCCASVVLCVLVLCQCVHQRCAGVCAGAAAEAGALPCVRATRRRGAGIDGRSGIGGSVKQRPSKGTQAWHRQWHIQSTRSLTLSLRCSAVVSRGALPLGAVSRPSVVPMGGRALEPRVWRSPSSARPARLYHAGDGLVTAASIKAIVRRAQLALAD
jgi:hypothetical protein